MKKSLPRAIVVCVLCLVLFAVVFLKDVSSAAHEILALLFTAALVAHLLLEKNAPQHASRRARQETLESPAFSRAATVAVSAAAGAAFLFCCASGLMQSHLLPFFNIGGAFPGVLHHVAFSALLILVTAHILLHVGFVRQMVHGFFSRRRPLAIAVCAGCALIIAAVLIGARLLAPSGAQSAPAGTGTTPLFGAPEPTAMPDFPSDLLDGEAE